MRSVSKSARLCPSLTHIGREAVEEEMMRERTRFETELVGLGLRDARQAHPFRERESLAYEIPPEPFRIRGGLYSAPDKRYHATHKGGLVRTRPPGPSSRNT